VRPPSQEERASASWPPCVQRAEVRKEAARFIGLLPGLHACSERRQVRKWRDLSLLVKRHDRTKAMGGNSVQNLISTPKTTYLCKRCNPLSRRKRNTKVSKFTIYSFNISLFRRQFFAFTLSITYRNTLSYPFRNPGRLLLPIRREYCLLNCLKIM
jgi:hypothetical protein